MKSIGWVLSGDERLPSARIHGLNLHERLVEQGVKSIILRQPVGFSDQLTRDEEADVFRKYQQHKLEGLILQKVNGESARRLARACRQVGGKVVYLACDKADDELANEADILFVVSEFLRTRFPRNIRRNMHVLEDSLEVPDSFGRAPITIPNEERLKAVYLASSYPSSCVLGMLQLCSEFVDVTIISSPPHPQQSAGVTKRRPASRPVESLMRCWPVLKSQGLGRVRRELEYRYRMWIAKREFPLVKAPAVSFKQWELSSVYESLSRFHVGLIPVEMISDFHLGKSANRLATLLAFGMPTVASPVPAYVQHAVHEQHVLFARRADDWRTALRHLDANRDHARLLGRNGQTLAWRRFHPDIIIREFCQRCGIE